jgi:hypothetical protein
MTRLHRPSSVFAVDQTGRIPKHNRWLVHQIDGITAQSGRTRIGMNLQKLETRRPNAATPKRR